MRGKIEYSFWYCGVFIISCLLMYLYKYPEALDIIRYFEQAEHDEQTYSSLLSYITDVSNSRVDFIYFAFLYLNIKIGIPLGFATTLVLFIYFVLLIKVSTLFINEKVDYLLLLSILMAVPTVTVISVSRNTFADVFLLLGIYNYLKGKKLPAGIFFLVAVLSHFSVLMYVGLFIIAIFLSKPKLDRKSDNIFRISLLSGSIIAGLVVPALLNDVLLNWSLSYLGGTHYELYDSLNDTSVLKAPQISNGDKLYFAYTFLMLLFLLLKDTNRDEMYWFMFLLFFLDAFYFNSSVHMSERLTILTPFCIGYSLNSLYSNKIVSKHTLHYISYSMLGVIFLYYYSVRPVFIIL